MNDRVVWSGDHDPLTPENLDAAAAVWIHAGPYEAFTARGRCYIRWGDKPVLSFSSMEREPDKWELVMSQNPKMGPFPEAVMDRYVVILRDVIDRLTRETGPSSEP